MSAVQIKVSDILGLLKAGKTRTEIAEMYSLNGVQLKELFKHPKLKNKKTVKEKGVAFQLIDDIEEEVVAAAVAENATNQVVEQPVEVQEAPVAAPVVEEVAAPVEEVAATEATAAPEAPQERSLWEND